ncbi:hypothetical protein MNB_SUP05-SYMBIONT-7-594 [hydrothermal vent metagenome]|uniref:Uncharacterized protein n=1 Tax=hydrothermal vent metagenome TaxID=652676 RepID=A0A1W1E3X5_9ZZZZ
MELSRNTDKRHQEKNEVVGDFSTDFYIIPKPLTNTNPPI